MMKNPSKSLSPGWRTDQSDTQNEDCGLGDALFLVLLGGRFFRGEATEGQKALGGCPYCVGRATWSLLGLVAPLSWSKAYFDEKLSWYYFPILFTAKTNRYNTLLKTMLDSSFLSKYGEIPEYTFEQSAWKSRYI
jgi:hypothetical protein